MYSYKQSNSSCFVPALSGGRVVAVPRLSESVLKKEKGNLYLYYPQIMLTLSFTVLKLKTL
jgi:hypothetical protein